MSPELSFSHPNFRSKLKPRTSGSHTGLGSAIDHLTRIPRHPLDPLTVIEVERVQTILSSYPPFLSSFPPIHSLVLDEADKNRVLGWKKGDPLPPRKASVIALVNGKSRVVTVDLDLGRVTSHVISPSSSYPILRMDDMFKALEVALSYRELKRSVTARSGGFSDLVCVTPSGGWFGPNEEGGRLIKVLCFSGQNTFNFYMRPIDGLVLTVDLDKGEVIRFSDTGQDIPIPHATNTDYRHTAQEEDPEMKPLNSISIEHLNGPSLSIEDGHVVKWVN
ncbi:Copper amine oxidase [Parasponia andersonii]|uniref:Amine oxidase n=1 Tax=Parasponia andersonii TaxID=3476 RepID=A0A2P5BYA1_PARAD|nr:Copper amine oxidase [Parasponia andersonii]